MPTAIWRLAGIGGLLLAWALAAGLVGSDLLLPSPWRVLAFAARGIADGELLRELAATLVRVVIAFTVAMLLASIIGYAMGRHQRIDALADPLLVIALNLPLLVVAILAYVWIGLNDVAAVLAVVMAKTPTTIVTIREGARALDANLDEMAAAFHVPRLRRWRSIILPQLAPYLAAAGRSGVSITWKIVLVVELLGRPNGIGFALNLAFQNFDVTAIIAYGLVFASIMLLIEALVLRPLERRANGWRADA